MYYPKIDNSVLFPIPSQSQKIGFFSIPVSANKIDVVEGFLFVYPIASLLYNLSASPEARKVLKSSTLVG